MSINVTVIASSLKKKRWKTTTLKLSEEECIHAKWTFRQDHSFSTAYFLYQIKAQEVDVKIISVEVTKLIYAMIETKLDYSVTVRWVIARKT